ncbi:hypothetical protein SKDZ_07G3020 [Saccharomyces kudriavzevii ZP591]|uniref:YGR053C-like protein n=1 Tax=Saccharomyces cerevisiae x Saccharomyces kudriavzevii (strain VIN7) TaxID=1095631 RepID=H0GV15_SACCK|nr:YGR053C-like protein [Saccharomyces cerevisiae x Saccharomyces kudriavzevii VIN7]CAI4062274.1 hypothetical protein SKDZ_07G3020 [Saccharomyces kudriavzevii ZP591]CAI5272533.1 AIS_HP2_G0019440.mRNA.1.CDS.1 [Saccharomyces cerevisiae]CAI6518403.1 AIS_HP2_G0019440.mRNA.1.CDS.1 [Saccharomyces cerevisiae]
MFLKSVSRSNAIAIKGTFSRWYSNSQKVANLGKMTDYLVGKGVPNLLQEMIKESVLADNIILRLFPTSHPYIPVLHGKSKYKASLNAIRMIVRKFILGEECRLHISSVKTLSSISCGGEAKDIPQNYNTITSNDKLVVKWQSCVPNDHCKISKLEINDKLKEKNQSNGGNNAFSMRSVPVIDYILHPTVNNLNQSVISEYIENAVEKRAQRTSNKGGDTEVGKNEKSDGASEKSKKKKLSRLIRGTFLFEFNEENSEILVHTIEDVELIHYEKKIATGGAFAC